MSNATPTTETRNQAIPRWAIDPSHTSVTFRVRHMMITNVRGEFGQLDGEVRFDPRRPGQASVKVEVDVASINTREDKRDAHLRSADFFDADNHPKMTFESKSVAKKGDGYEITGDLTIRGTTREIVLKVDDVTAEHTDPWGGRRIGASASAKIKRSDFGMTWNTALEAGGVLVGDEVTIGVDVSLVKQP